MKRLLTLSALALAMLVALTACGSEPEQPPEDDTDPVIVDTQDPPADDVQEPPVKEGGAELASLRDKLVSDYNVEGAMSISGADTLQRLYGIDPAWVVSAEGFTAPTADAFPLEVVLVEAVDAAAANEVEAKFNDRLATIAEQAASYDPVSLELAETGPVAKSGVFVALFFTADHAGMASDFQSSVG